jgi:hypothetical protein
MPFAAYLSFATGHRRFLSFGFVLAPEKGSRTRKGVKKGVKF